MPKIYVGQDCPKCGSKEAESNYGGERGEAGPAQNSMSEAIAALIEEVAAVIDENLDLTKSIRLQGGPYETSLILTAQKKLAEAAAAVLYTIINHPGLRQAQKSS